MVSPGIMQQGVLFLHAMALGVVMIFCYDLLRIFRRGVPHGTVWIAVEDMFFWLLSAFVLFRLMYEENDGKLRWFVIMGVLVGMILYNVSFSRLVVRFGSVDNVLIRTNVSLFLLQFFCPILLCLQLFFLCLFFLFVSFIHPM